MSPADMPDQLVQAVVDVLQQNSLWGGWLTEQHEEAARDILAAVLPLYEQLAELDTEDATPPADACRACGRDFSLPYVIRRQGTDHCEDCAPVRRSRDGSAR